MYNVKYVQYPLDKKSFKISVFLSVLVCSGLLSKDNTLPAAKLIWITVQTPEPQSTNPPNISNQIH